MHSWRLFPKYSIPAYRKYSFALSEKEFHWLNTLPNSISMIPNKTKSTMPLISLHQFAKPTNSHPFPFLLHSWANHASSYHLFTPYSLSPPCSNIYIYHPLPSRQKPPSLIPPKNPSPFPSSQNLPHFYQTVSSYSHSRLFRRDAAYHYFCGESGIQECCEDVRFGSSIDPSLDTTRRAFSSPSSASLCGTLRIRRPSRWPTISHTPIRFP